jgi:hypothetical protein
MRSDDHPYLNTRGKNSVMAKERENVKAKANEK